MNDQRNNERVVASTHTTTREASRRHAMGVGPPASASRGASSCRGGEAAPLGAVRACRGGARTPRHIDPRAAGLELARRSRGAPSASTVRHETRASAGVVRPGGEATRASANAGVVVQDGRRVFEPFERKRRGGRTSAEDGENGGIGAEETRVERVRQIIDDSHLPSLPPLPPDAPLAPPSGLEAFGAGGETGRDETENAGAATKRVAGGDFVWSKPLR